MQGNSDICERLIYTLDIFDEVLLSVLYRQASLNYGHQYVQNLVSLIFYYTIPYPSYMAYEMFTLIIFTFHVHLILGYRILFTLNFPAHSLVWILWLRRPEKLWKLVTKIIIIYSLLLNLSLHIVCTVSDSSSKCKAIN